MPHPDWAEKDSSVLTCPSESKTVVKEEEEEESFCKSCQPLSNSLTLDQAYDSQMLKNSSNRYTCTGLSQNVSMVKNKAQASLKPIHFSHFIIEL